MFVTMLFLAAVSVDGLIPPPSPTKPSVIYSKADCKAARERCRPTFEGPTLSECEALIGQREKFLARGCTHIANPADVEGCNQEREACRYYKFPW